MCADDDVLDSRIWENYEIPLVLDEIFSFKQTKKICKIQIFKSQINISKTRY